MKKIYWLPVLVAVFTLGFLYFLMRDVSHKQSTHPLMGKPMPEISLQNLKGMRLSSDLFKGKPTLVLFFSTWCPSCMMMKAVLEDLPVRLVGILYRDKGFMADASPFDISLFEEIVLDHDGTEGISWGIKGVPELFLINKDGFVIWHHRGALSREMFDKDISPLL